MAARCQGTEERVNETDTECPICFLQYCAINKTKCCQAYICTECYLQVRNPKETSTACPFCNQKLSVTVAHVSEEAIRERRSEEQRVIEAQIRASTSQKQQQQSPTSTTGGTGSSEQTPPGSSATLPPLSAKPRNTHFGASLEQNERVARMRKRSSSGSGDLGSSITSSAHSTTPTRDAAVSSLKSLAMTPAERQALEAEMKAQHHHPLTQRMQQEEEERRFRNQQEYINSPQYQLRQQQQQQQDRLRDLHARRLLMGRSSSSQQQRTTRDWNRIVQAFESGTAGNSVQSLDDLVVLEAAIMLSSMEQSSGSRQRGGDGEDASAEGRPVSADASDENGSDENDDDFATRHARAGFPLARARGANSSFASESLLSRNHGGGGSGSSHRPWMMAALMPKKNSWPWPSPHPWKMYHHHPLPQPTPQEEQQQLLLLQLPPSSLARIRKMTHSKEKKKNKTIRHHHSLRNHRQPQRRRP